MKTTAPLSKVQYGIYAECITHQGEACYNLPYLYVLDGSLDEEKLRMAIETAVAAHPTLFTRIELDSDGDPQQTIDDSETFTLTVERTADIEAEKQRMITAFDLYRDRLFHIRLLRDDGHFYFFLDIHHIIGDGTTLKVMLADVEKAYNGEPLEPEAMTMAQVATAEAELRATPAFDEAKQWYAQNFDCGDCFTQLMPDLEIPEHSEASMVRTLGIEMARVDAFCKEKGIFKSNFFTTVYSFLLAKYNNEQESLFTTIYNGRTDKRFLHSVGMTVKTLPVYAKFTNDTTVLDYLKAGQDQMSGVRQHEAYAFSDVVNDLGLQSNSMFAWHGMMFADEKLCDKPMKTIRLCNSTLEASLYLKAFILNGRYQVKAEYNSNEYSEALIAQYLESYEAVAEGFLTQEYLRDVNIATASQVELLDSFNQTDVDYDDTQTIVSLFRRQAKATPGNIAVVYKDNKYTYAEVDEMSDRIAGYIASKGLGTEDVVSVLIPRCEWMAIASLGVLKAGCAYQPLDPTYPKERLNFMMQDAGAKLLIADEELRSIVDEYKGDVLLTKDLLAMPAATEQPAEPNPSSLFILLYTSGSTGVPKGCQLMHSNLVCFCHWYQLYYALKPEHKVAAYASYGFDACMMDMYPALTCGAAVHIIPEEIRLDLIALNDYLEREQITHSFMTTQVGYQFATSIENHSLKYLSTGGEKLASLTPPMGYEFYNGYGPTECTIFTTTYLVEKKMKEIPIGKPLDNMRLYIVDPQGHRLPMGAAGELWISGPQVSRGYLNRPEKTAEVYIGNPFIDDDKYARVYRSGDIVRYLPSGDIQFVGRRDGQVKIRGFRIELKEVEAVIREFRGIKDATVQAFDEEGGNGKFIAAYIVSDEQVDIEALNNFILDQKPPYMVPAVTMQIDAIPLNQNQKVNKRALPKPVKAVAVQQLTEQAPLNVLEQELLEMVAGIVNNTEFGITTVLGYAGLTSISAIKLAVQVNKRYGVALDSKSLVKTGTLQSIENEILSRMLNSQFTIDNSQLTAQSSADANNGQSLMVRSCSARLLPEGRKNGQLKDVPLSYAQMGVYYECMKHPLDTTYNTPFKLTFPSGTDGDAVERALRQIIQAHPAFSIHFETRDNDVVQISEPDHVPQVVRSQMSDEELDAHVKEYLLPYHLDRGPLYRMEIVETGNRLVLLVDVHHLIFDGASADLFFRQLCRLLEGGTIDEETCGYLQFSYNQRQKESGEEYQRARAYFAEVMKECEGCTELTDDYTPLVPHGHIARVERPFDFARVEQFCRQLNVTPASMMLAVAFYALSRYANTRHVYISTISNGRSDLSLADTTGMFVNTLPLAGHITEQTVEEFVRRTSQDFEETMRHEQYPFARIAADYDFSASTTYTYQVGVIEDYTIGGRKVEIETMELDVPKQKLDIVIRQKQGQTIFSLEYDDAFYGEKTMNGLAESLASVLEHFMEAPQGSLLKVSMLSAAQEQMVNEFRMAGTAEVPTRLFHHAIEANAAQKPDAKAMVACDGTFTYSELNAEMNRVANALIAHGVKRGDRVAMLLPRTSRLIFTMFGIMKAGAAYIPCDPHYPVDRIKLILEDSEAAYIVTDDENLANLKEQSGEGSLEVLEKALNIEELLQCENTANPAIPQEGSDLAYIIYTSGSTGRPKGVMLHHSGICNELFAHPLNYRNWTIVHEVKCILGLATISFDASVEEIGLPLYNGLTLALASDEIANDPIRLAEFMVENNVGMFQGTPSRLMQLYESDIFRKALAGCRSIELGGEKFSDSQLHELQKTTTAHIFNSYGPTETTVESNCHEVTHEEHVSIGRPLVNVTEYIVDADMNRVPVGVVGELLVGGAQVSLGYNKLPEKTREAFIENPFISSLPDQGGISDKTLYRTGDYARWDEHGYITILGRTDNQVKLRGLRIELGEIESVIAKQEGIGQVIVMIRKINGKEHLCAYFTANHPVDIDALKVEIAKSLTQYMVPTAYLQLDKMPTTPSGKTDMKALPEPELSVSTEYVEPVGELERQLCEIFAKILLVERVGATDDFFELGGTSLVVTRLIIDVDKIGHHLAYGDVFDHPTPRQIAALLTGTQVAEEVKLESEVKDYDYTAINQVLAGGTLEAFQNGTPLTLGHVLLTGATGYLGIHILYELIQSEAGTITCLVRGKSQSEAQQRLQTLLFYYFASAYREQFESGRLSVVAGDVTDDICSVCGKNINTVFNCAAIVKHFSKDNDIEHVNVDGTQRCVDFCLKTGAKLIQVSTVSVGGFLVHGEKTSEAYLDEQSLFKNQYLGNQYTLSKYLSERIVLEAVAAKGLVGKVMRVGNLSARSTDGEFQVNFRTNSFAGKMGAYSLLGCCPYGNFTNPVEFSPINEVAKAICLLATTPRECCMFHPYNNHNVYLGDVLGELDKVGTPVRMVEQDEFLQALDQVKADPTKADRIRSLVAYTDMTHGQAALPVQEVNDYTMQVLYRQGFFWSPTSWDYVDRFFQSIAGFGFFENE